MSTRPRQELDDLIILTLTDLDAAPPAARTPQQRLRADDTLARILDSHPLSIKGPAPVTGRAGEPRGRRRSRRARQLTRGVLLVAAALALTLVISTSGIIGGSPAYASWTAVPTPHPAAEQERIAQECRDQLSQGAAQENEDDIPTAADLQASDLVVADSRGAWSYVLLGGANGLHATCLVEESESRTLGVFPRAKSAAGSYGFMSDLPEPAPDEIIGTGLMAMGAPEGSYWSTDGYVGSEVATVSVLTAGGTRVEATVTDGRFAAWWPERESLGPDDGLDAVTYLITLKDGTELPGVDYDGIGPHWQE